MSRNILWPFSQHGAVSKLFPLSKVLLTYQTVKIQFLYLMRMQQKMIQSLKKFSGPSKILKFILQERTVWWMWSTNIIISFVRHMPHRGVSRRKLMMIVYQCFPLRPPGITEGQRSTDDLIVILVRISMRFHFACSMARWIWCSIWKHHIIQKSISWCFTSI